MLDDDLAVELHPMHFYYQLNEVDEPDCTLLLLVFEK
jgi:hypothetical protein